MAITTSDVPVQEQSILRQLEERTAPMYQFRRAFREFDASDSDNEEIQFPVPADAVDRDTLQELGELSHYPRIELSYDTESAEVGKYGFELVISDEAVRFGRVPVEVDAQLQASESEARSLDAQAYNLLDSNAGDSIGDGSEAFSHDLLIDAYVHMVEKEYSPENFELYLGPQAFGAAAKDDRFNRATEQGDALARNGQLGSMFGMNHVLSNTGDLSTDAFLVDRSKFGYEVTWEPVDVSSYRENDVDGTIYKVNGMWGWAVTDPDACLRIDTGSGA